MVSLAKGHVSYCNTHDFSLTDSNNETKYVIFTFCRFTLCQMDPFYPDHFVVVTAVIVSRGVSKTFFCAFIYC